jgi:hypothetical protein
MPDALHLEFYRDRTLLADLMKCGVAMLNDALSWFKKVELEAGYVVVLEEEQSRSLARGCRCPLTNVEDSEQGPSAVLLMKGR